jgi:plasmid stabilization system protein ParE
MGMRLIWTAFAATQLENLYRFLNNKSETAAVSVYNDILDETERLLHFAEMAPIEPLLSEFSEVYRSLVIRSTYKVVYYTTNNSIFIVAVFDCRQNPEKLKKHIRKRKQQE